jgi:hypothetical protein
LCYTYQGKGDFSPCPLPCQLFYQKKNCNYKVYDRGNKIDCACWLVFLIAAFLLLFLAQRLNLLSVYYYTIYVRKKQKKISGDGITPPPSFIYA